MMRQPDWQSEDGRHRLLFGDCLDRMGEIATGSIDLILADLPYGTTACKWDTVIPFEPLWAHYRRVIKPRGAIVLTASQPFTSALVMSNPKWFRDALVWEKSKPTGFLHAKNKNLKSHEDIIIFSPATANHASLSSLRMTFNPQFGVGKPYRKIDRVPNVVSSSHNASAVNLRHVGRVKESRGTRYPRSVVYFPNPNNFTIHHTQKPVALMEYLIRTYTNAGETVLDNTVGSGTTVVAALNTDRQSIGVEKDPEIYATARTRIEAAIRARAEMLIPA
jgi:site-specific DNA-methyltransferase (adenine-specific)